MFYIGSNGRLYFHHMEVNNHKMMGSLLVYVQNFYVTTCSGRHEGPCRVTSSHIKKHYSEEEKPVECIKDLTNFYDTAKAKQQLV